MTPEPRAARFLKSKLVGRGPVNLGVHHLMKYFIATFVLLTLAHPACATNRGFMRGDACFHSILTKDLCTALADSDSPLLPFVRPKGEKFAFCGYAGYWSLQLPAGSEPLVKNLGVLYTSLRRNSPRELREHTDEEGTTSRIETNGFHLFVYNRDFDPLEYDIALRYNETWVDDESSFGPHPSITRLEPFVIDRVAFSNDWRDAAAVPPLRTECPPIPEQEKRMKLGMGNKRIDAPVVAQGEVQIIVAVSDNLRRYVNRRRGATFYSVTNSGVKQYIAKHGEWVVTDWSPERE